MSEEQDIRSLLQSKARAKVNPRNPSLFSESPKSTEIIPEPDEETQDPDEETKQKLDNVENHTDDLKVTSKKLELESELNNLPQVGKRLAIHLESELRNDLLKLCNSQEITPEIFFEAAYLLLQEKPKLKAKVISNAKNRLQARKRAGLVRRTLSMIDKLSN